MMTLVSDDKPEILFHVLTECQNLGLVCVTISEQFSLTAGVLICLIRVMFFLILKLCIPVVLRPYVSACNAYFARVNVRHRTGVLLNVTQNMKLLRQLIVFSHGV